MNQRDYLDKVVNNIADETVTIGIEMDEYLSTPFYSPFPFPLSLSQHRHISYATLPFSPFYSFFEDYVIKVYGLTKRESGYVWKQYKEKIINQYSNR